MSIINIDGHLRAVPVIRSLVENRARRFRREHPLWAGLRAFDQWERGEFTGHLRDLFQLELDARVIIEHLIGRGWDTRIENDLAKEHECRALLHEARTAALLLKPYVASLEWRRYEKAGSDFVTSGPEMQVECTQLDRYDLAVMFERATKKRHQRRDSEGPFVVIVGSQESSATHVFVDIQRSLNANVDDWYGRHPEVSAFHFFAPRPIEPCDVLTEIDSVALAFRFDYYTGFTARNVKAFKPLAAGFENNWRR